MYLCGYANCAAQFISAYAGGLTGADLKWVNKPYRGHQILPLSMIAEIKRFHCTVPSQTIDTFFSSHVNHRNMVLYNFFLL
jgi:hypothetical protein